MADEQDVNGGAIRFTENGDMTMFSPQGFSGEELQEILEETGGDQNALFERLGFEQPDVDYRHDHRTRVADTDAMREITLRATEMRLNRRLNHLLDPTENTYRDEFDQLAPDRYHVLVPIFIHKYAEQEPTEPHMRVQAYLMYKGTRPEEAVQRILDIPMRLWKRLPNLESAQDDRDIRRHTEEHQRWEEDTARARERMGSGRAGQVPE